MLLLRTLVGNAPDSVESYRRNALGRGVFGTTLAEGPSHVPARPAGLRTQWKCRTSWRVTMNRTNIRLRSSHASTREATHEACGTSELLSQRQVAVRLGVSARTIEGWRARGVGPPFLRLSARAVRYRAVDLEQWLDQRRVADQPQLENSGGRDPRLPLG